jgi:hypothetical protein
MYWFIFQYGEVTNWLDREDLKWSWTQDELYSRPLFDENKKIKIKIIKKKDTCGSNVLPNRSTKQAS